MLRLWEKAADVLGSIRTRMMPLKDMEGGWMDGWMFGGMWVSGLVGRQVIVCLCLCIAN